MHSIKNLAALALGTFALTALAAGTGAELKDRPLDGQAAAPVVPALAAQPAPVAVPSQSQAQTPAAAQADQDRHVKGAKAAKSKKKAAHRAHKGGAHGQQRQNLDGLGAVAGADAQPQKGAPLDAKPAGKLDGGAQAGQPQRQSDSPLL